MTVGELSDCVDHSIANARAQAHVTCEDGIALQMGRLVSTAEPDPETVACNEKHLRCLATRVQQAP